MPEFVHHFVTQLRRRRLALGVDDCDALRQALAAGMGWASEEHMRELCVALWATSQDEATLIRAVFARVDPPSWTVSAGRPLPAPTATRAGDAVVRGPLGPMAPPPALPGEGELMRLEPLPGPAPAAPGSGGLPPLPLLASRDRSLVLLPQYPVSERQVVQIWRRLRQARRYGPATELDPAATLARFAATGLPTPPVLVPPRRNTASLVLLLDWGGSMTPFHNYVDHIAAAIRRAGRLDALTVAYFHDTAGAPSAQPDRPDPFSPAVDAVLDRVAPLEDGRLYADAEMSVPLPFGEFLAAVTPRTGAVVISDAGGARGELRPDRTLETIALLKAAMRQAPAVAWLNPVAAHRWSGTTAAQIARHVPMFPLTAAGMHRAVDVLRGHPFTVERPL